MQVFRFVLICLAAYRLWRFAGEDTAPYLKRPREWFMDWAGRASAVVELLVCPWCSGTWFAWGLTALVWWRYPMEAPVLQALAAATIVGLIGHNLDA